MNRALAFCVGSLLLVAPFNVGHAAEDGGGKAYAPCDVHSGEDEILECDKIELAKEDAALNVAYKRLYSIMTPYQKGLLQKAERAWIQYRDAECEFQGAQLMDGALPGETLRDQAVDRADCLLDVTHSRVESLKSIEKEAREGGAGSRR